MQERINNIQQNAFELLNKAQDSAALSEFWQKYLSKNGEITSLMKELRNVSPNERPNAGKLINSLKEHINEEYENAAQRIKTKEMNELSNAQQIDISLPAKVQNTGGLHPITLVKHEILDVFCSMGFFVYEGPEIEDDEHNFTRLNVPEDHPARDMQDTFYITSEFLLRTHTSPGQVRVMDNQKPPIKVLVPGRVFRSDSDATHSPMFHQMEGLVVDKGINLSDLQGMLNSFVKALFGDETNTRLRPSFFPFTEPSVEVDVSCFSCKGNGCNLCKGTGWIEVLGGGVVNRKVLKNCGINPDEYSGIAFGIGIERIAMLKYGINHMGLLFENDVRFLQQFKAGI